MNAIPATSGVYKITCTANRRFYIGSAINLCRRQYEHWRHLQQNKHVNLHMQRAWKKYGEQAFTFEVLEQVLPMSLTAREQYWLNKLKPFGRKGFNIARDADAAHLGMRHTLETREKMRGRKVSSETIDRLRQSHLGKKQSPEAIEKHRLSMIGHETSSETIERIKQAHLSTGHKPSPEAIEAARQVNLGREKTPEELEKLRLAMLGNKHGLGKKQSPETIAKRVAANTGKKRSPEQRERMRQSQLARLKAE
jgi:group I intron endonuclease